MKRLIAFLMLLPSIVFAQGEIINQPTRTAAQVTDKAAAWLPIWDANGGARNTFKLSVADLATLTSTLTNGDKGDITLSGSPAGSVWTVDAGLFAPFSHTHAIIDVTGLQAALDGKAALSHTHVIANITGLQTALDGKAALSHTHVIGDTTGLQAALDGKAALAHSHAAADINSGTFASARFGANTVAHSALANTSANGRLIGSPAGSAAVGEITLGSGLSLTGSTLSATASGGTPGGATTQLQYNNAGAFAGAADVVYSTGQLSVTPAWSGTGTATTPFLVNVSANPGPAAAGSKLVDLQLLGSSKFSVTSDGQASASDRFSSTFFVTGANASAGFYARSNTPVLAFGTSDDVILTRDNADILAQRRLTTAQKFAVYNTWANSGIDFERGVMDWKGTANTFRIGTEQGGTGVSRAVSIVTGGTERIIVSSTGATTIYNTLSLPSHGISCAGLNANFTAIKTRSDSLFGFTGSSDPSDSPDTAIARSSAGVLKVTNGSTGFGTLESGPHNITPAWSGTGVATTPLKINVTADPGPADATSKLFDFQIAGVSTVAGTKRGSIYFPVTFGNGAALPGPGIGNYFGHLGLYGTSGAQLAYVSSAGISTNGASTGFLINDDVVLTRDNSDILALRRGTTAQKLSVYNTYANSGTDYERGVFDWKGTSNTLRIGTEMGGTGVARAVSIVTGGVERIGISHVANGGSWIWGGLYTQPASGATIDTSIGFNGTATISVRSAGTIGFSSTSDARATPDIALTRPAANILGITNGSTGPGKLAIDNVQGANLERLKMEWASNVARIGTEKAGSGVARDFAIITDDTPRVTVAATTGVATFSADQIRIASDKTPTSATDTGVAGTVCIDDNFIYVCTATNTWKRAALSTW